MEDMSMSPILPDHTAAGNDSTAPQTAVQSVTAPMRVRYDISILGYGHVHGSSGRTGIHRVVEELAVRLAASPRCDLSFCAINCLPEARRYVAETDTWRGSERLNIKNNAVLRMPLNFLAERISTGKSPLALPFRAIRKPLHLMYQRFCDANYPAFPVGDLSQIDVFHATTDGLPPFVTQRRGLACIQTVYDLIPVLFEEFAAEHQKRQMATILGGLTPNSWALVISQATKNDLCAYTGMNPERVFVTPLAADRERFYPCTDAARIDDIRTRHDIPPGRYLLSVCTLEPRKNLDALIRHFARIAREPDMADCSLVLTGNVGWMYERIAAALQDTPDVRDRIVLAGFVADEDLAPLYSGATAFCYPSLYEGFGLPPLEAMQCGTPVMTSNTSSLPEVVGDGGLMFDPRDADAWCHGLLEVCANETLRQTLAKRALARAAQFSWERCATQTLDAYAAAIAGT